MQVECIPNSKMGFTNKSLGADLFSVNQFGEISKFQMGGIRQINNSTVPRVISPNTIRPSSNTHPSSTQPLVIQQGRSELGRSPSQHRQFGKENLVPVTRMIDGKPVTVYTIQKPQNSANSTSPHVVKYGQTYTPATASTVDPRTNHSPYKPVQKFDSRRQFTNLNQRARSQESLPEQIDREGNSTYNIYTGGEDPRIQGSNFKNSNSHLAKNDPSTVKTIKKYKTPSGVSEINPERLDFDNTIYSAKGKANGDSTKTYMTLSNVVNKKIVKQPSKKRFKSSINDSGGYQPNTLLSTSKNTSSKINALGKNYPILVQSAKNPKMYQTGFNSCTNIIPVLTEYGYVNCMEGNRNCLAQYEIMNTGKIKQTEILKSKSIHLIK